MHNISVINGREAFVYTGEVPWHGLGAVLTRVDSVEQALVEANLNWLVRKEPLFLQGMDVDIHSAISTPDIDFSENSILHLLGKEVKDIKAVVRDIDSQILGTVGSRYKLIQNHEAFAPLQHAIDNHGATIETAGALGVGDRIWMLVKLPSIGEVVPGDNIEPYFLVTNSHTRERSQSLTARFTPVRVVCQNTLDAAEARGRSAISIRHTASATERINEIEGVILYTLESYTRSLETYQQLASIQVSPVDMALYLLKVWPMPTEEEALALGKNIEEMKPSEQLAREHTLFLFENGHGTEIEGVRGTAWASYNACAEWVDHCSVLRQDGQKKKTGAMSAVFGSGAIVKRRALDLAISMFLPQHEEARVEDFV